ncbi:MAG TPA: SDR family NAD(P)-dependent oxidoreductase [Solirubrobacteraceae bacterium]|nr:SDR family NAD(P)-dependent oxidoreductase [Solirubrobacteraceae bacterium]
MVALVTGASSGIGAATARRLSREPGASLVLVARRADRLRTLARSLGEERTSWVAVDLEDVAAAERIRTHIEQLHGRLDLLVNNAGGIWRAEFADGGYENVRRTMAINFDAQVRLTEALLPLLRASAPSAIVNVSSLAARVARGGTGAYSASKFALAGWSDSLWSEERSHGVHVGLVIPGFIATEGFPQTDLTASMLTRWMVSTPERAADAIFQAGVGRRPERYVPKPYALAALLRALAPALMRRIMSATPPPAPESDPNLAGCSPTAPAAHSSRRARKDRSDDAPGARPAMPFWHAAYSVRDLHRTYDWYHATLGLEYARGTNLFVGPHNSWIQGLRGATSACWWLNDRQDAFQLEVFEYRKPLMRTHSGARRPCDIGYASISFHVDDLDAALQRAERHGSPRLSDPIGAPGTRRVCVRDPDGILVELMEDDPREHTERERPRTHVQGVARSVTLSVADLERSRRLLVDGLGLREADDVQLHTPEHEALWGLAGATRDTALFWADDFLVEVVSYRQPRAAEREPSYRISDQGIFHICFGTYDTAEFHAVLKRCRAAGFRGNSPVISYGAAGGLYLVDEQSFTIELLHKHPRLEQAAAGEPRFPPQRMPLRIGGPAQVRQRRRFSSAVVLGADTPIGSELCRLLAEDDTSLWLLDRVDVHADADADVDAGAGSGVAALARALRASARGTIQAFDLADLRELLKTPAGVNARVVPELVVGLPLAPGPAANGALPSDSPNPVASSSLELISSLFERPPECAIEHVTVVADPAERHDLPKLGQILTRASCTTTLATVGSVPPSYAAAAPLKRALGLTPREAAEMIYLATLRRKRAVQPRPNAWPPRRGASEAPAVGGSLFIWPNVAPGSRLLKQA